jgi:hypothetical protein
VLKVPKQNSVLETVHANPTLFFVFNFFLQKTSQETTDFPAPVDRF